MASCRCSGRPLVQKRQPRRLCLCSPCLWVWQVHEGLYSLIHHAPTLGLSCLVDFLAGAGDAAGLQLVGSTAAARPLQLCGDGPGPPLMAARPPIMRHYAWWLRTWSRAAKSSLRGAGHRPHPHRDDVARPAARAIAGRQRRLLQGAHGGRAGALAKHPRALREAGAEAARGGVPCPVQRTS
jgi:hypothetical protein